MIRVVTVITIVIVAGPASVADTSPPVLKVLKPKPGETVAGPELEVELLARDPSGVRRVVIDGSDVAPLGQEHRVLKLTHALQLPPGPRLIRIEAVDPFGNASWTEVPVAAEPFLAAGQPDTGCVLDVSGSAGYAAIARRLEPRLSRVPELVRKDVRGHLYVDHEELLKDIVTTVTGERGKLAPPELRLLPACKHIRLEVEFSQLEVQARGQLEYPPPIDAKAGFGAEVTVGPAIASAALRFETERDTDRVEAFAEHFSCALGAVDVDLSTFWDPLEIRDALHSALVGRFQTALASQLRQAVEQEVRRSLLPELAAALARLADATGAPSPALSALRSPIDSDRLFAAVLERPAGLSVVLDAACLAARPDRNFPVYPGSCAESAPYPGFPLGFDVGHPAGAVLSVSTDALNQLLAEMAAAGLFTASFDLKTADSPFLRTAQGIAAVFGSRLLEVPGVRPEQPLRLRIEAREPPRLRLRDLRPRRSGEGETGAAAELAEPSLLPEGSLWLVHEHGPPPSGWTELEFDDADWTPSASGFGCAHDEDALPADVHTVVGAAASGTLTSLCLRGRFDLQDPERLVSALLRVRYSGGFRAFLNGEKIAEEGPTEPRDGGSAGSNRAEPEPETHDIEIAAFRHHLLKGPNVVAIEALGIEPPGFVLVPELFDRVPKASRPLNDPLGDETPAEGDPGARHKPAFAELEFPDLELAFCARTKAGEIDLVAFRLGLRFETEVEVGAERLVLTIDTTDGDDRDTLPDAVVGRIFLGVAYEAVDLDDGRLTRMAKGLLPWLGPYVSAALGEFEAPSLALPELVFAAGQDGALEGLETLRSTLASVDTNGGDPDWLCVVAEVRE